MGIKPNPSSSYCTHIAVLPESFMQIFELLSPDRYSKNKNREIKKYIPHTSSEGKDTKQKSDKGCFSNHFTVLYMKCQDVLENVCHSFSGPKVTLHKCLVISVILM